MRGGLALATSLIALIFSSAAWAASGAWERSFGYNVVTGGSTGLEICTIASTCKSGDVPIFGGALSGPHGVAADPLGDVYTSEPGTGRVQRFDSAGNWKSAWGDGVNGTNGV